MIEHNIVTHFQRYPGNIACRYSEASVPVLARLSLLNIHNFCQVILATVGNLDQAAYDTRLEEGLIDPLLQGMALHVQGLQLCIVCRNILIIFVLHIQRGTAHVPPEGPPFPTTLDVVVKQEAVRTKGTAQRRNY